MHIHTITLTDKLLRWGQIDYKRRFSVFGESLRSYLLFACHWCRLYNMLWLIVLLVGIPCLLIWDYLIRKKRNDMLNYMGGPPTLPFLGSVHLYRGLDGEREFFNSKTTNWCICTVCCNTINILIAGVMDYALANCAKYGKMYRIWILNQLAVFSTDPRDVEIILSSTQQIKKNSLYNLMLPWLGTGPHERR